MAELLYKEEVYRIQGAIFEVYRELGNGFLEAVYQEALERELSSRSIPYSAQPRLEITYKGTVLRQEYIPDFVCFGGIIVELKAVSKLNDKHLAQMLNYLKASGLKLGLIVNFGGSGKVDIQRGIRDALPRAQLKQMKNLTTEAQSPQRKAHRVLI